MGIAYNANEVVSEDDVEGHGMLRNAALATAIAVGGGAVATAGPASAEEACVATTEKLCVDAGDDAYVGDVKAESEDAATESAGFVIGLLTRSKIRR